MYCTVLYNTLQHVASLVDTHLLESESSHQCLVLWTKSLVVGGGWWHCNYSFKLQGSRGDLESLPLVELDRRHKESNSWTPSLTIFLFFSLTPAHLLPPTILNRENLFLVFSVETGVYIFSQNFKIAHKAHRGCAENFYICPHFVLFLSSFGLLLKKLLKFC